MFHHQQFLSAFADPILLGSTVSDNEYQCSIVVLFKFSSEKDKFDQRNTSFVRKNSCVCEIGERERERERERTMKNNRESWLGSVCVCLMPCGCRKNQQDAVAAFCFVIERERETLLGFGKSNKYKIATLPKKERQWKEEDKRARQRRIKNERKSSRWFVSFFRSSLLLGVQCVATKQMLIVSFFLLYWFGDDEVCWTLTREQEDKQERKMSKKCVM